MKSLLPRSTIDEHAHQQSLNWPSLPIKHKIFNSSLCSLKKRCQQRQQRARECWLLTSLSIMQIVNFYEPFMYLPRRMIQRSVSRSSLTKKSFRDMQLFWRSSLVRYDTWHRKNRTRETLLDFWSLKWKRHFFQIQLVLTALPIWLIKWKPTGLEVPFTTKLQCSSLQYFSSCAMEWCRLINRMITITIIIATSYWELIKVINAIKIMISIGCNKNILDDIDYKKAGLRPWHVEN